MLYTKKSNSLCLPNPSSIFLICYISNLNSELNKVLLTLLKTNGIGSKKILIADNQFISFYPTLSIKQDIINNFQSTMEDFLKTNSLQLIPVALCIPIFDSNNFTCFNNLLTIPNFFSLFDSQVENKSAGEVICHFLFNRYNTFLPLLDAISITSYLSNYLFHTYPDKTFVDDTN